MNITEASATDFLPVPHLHCP